jgi:hypothetical protein
MFLFNQKALNRFHLHTDKNTSGDIIKYIVDLFII